MRAEMSLLKLSPSGELLWRRHWDKELYTAYNHAFVVADAAGVWVVGSRYTGDMEVSYGADAARFDADGTLEWAHSYSGGTDSLGHPLALELHAAQPAPDGGLYVAGSLRHELQASPVRRGLAVLTLDADGIPGAASCIDADPWCRFATLALYPDGDLLAGGVYGAEFAVNAMVLRLSPQFEPRWCSTYDRPEHGGIETLLAAAVTSDGYGCVLEATETDFRFLRAYSPDGSSVDDRLALNSNIEVGSPYVTEMFVQDDDLWFGSSSKPGVFSWSGASGGQTLITPTVATLDTFATDWPLQLVERSLNPASLELAADEEHGIQLVAYLLKQDAP
jgi:hypothetical protein